MREPPETLCGPPLHQWTRGRLRRAGLPVLRPVTAARRRGLAPPGPGGENRGEGRTMVLRVRRLWLIAPLLALVAGLVSADDNKSKGEPLVEKVRTAIDTGVRYLRKEERDRGGWER